MKTLNLTPFRMALASLRRGLARLQRAPEDEEVRDGCIQRFEYCFELGIKMIKRQLDMDALIPIDMDGMSFRNVLRLAVEHRLITSADDWVGYRELRNFTAHTYDLAKAQQVAGALPGFLTTAELLLKRLEEGAADAH